MKRLPFTTTAIFCFSFALFIYGGILNSVFAQEDNSSNNNNISAISIPTTISEEAQNALKNITAHMPEFVTPELGDLEG